MNSEKLKKGDLVRPRWPDYPRLGIVVEYEVYGAPNHVEYKIIFPNGKFAWLWEEDVLFIESAKR
jgi:hypothetical protein